MKLRPKSASVARAISTTIVQDHTKHPLRSALLWIITQRVVAIPYRRFGTTYRSHLEGSGIQKESRHFLCWKPSACGELDRLHGKKQNDYVKLQDIAKYFKDICKIYNKIVSRLQELVNDSCCTFQSCRLKHTI